MDVEIKLTGPIVENRAEPIIERGIEVGLEKVGEQGVNDVRAATSVFRNPTGFYSRQLTSDLRVDSVLIHDGGVVYGSWLEGVGSRNRTSRFKGYSFWRRTRQELERKAPRIFEQAIEPYVRQLG